jgi:threonine dehydratase
VFSFKLRGAYNKMQHLSAEQRERGVVAASAGNHAQGLAMAAQRMGRCRHHRHAAHDAAIKVDAVRGAARKVVLHGDSFDEAYAHRRRRPGGGAGLTYVHPFDDPDVIAGQGTVGMEIVRQHQEPLDAVFVPVGGGGLLAGVAAYIRYVWPQHAHHRRGARGRGLPEGGPGARPARDAARGRAVRRWLRRGAGRQGDLPRRSARRSTR